MAKRNEPCERFLKDHNVAVRLEDTILVFLDFDPKIEIENKTYGDQEVWTYNLWTEQWKAHTIHPDTREEGIITRSKLGVAIAPDVYIFAALRKINVLWKLTKRNNGSFASTTISLIHKTQYSARIGHCDWVHENKLWIFGGYTQGRFSNELFCCDPSVQTFSSVICLDQFPHLDHVLQQQRAKIKFGCVEGRGILTCMN